MAEIKLVATLISKDGSGEAVREILTGLTAKSRAENGCVAYELYESAAAPGTFITIEVWADQEALDGHMRGLNLKFAAAALRAHLDGAPALHPLIAVDA
ncbi:putative quinol monooxygenase [Tomitella biformata]|uniref:putative quinol monooxygenase n=1 Tax=Tomitella biformata TaxID=630403 RepID=UPI0004668D3B|nr:putative quinol monooxygenase [Tomitella biformata]